MHWVENQLTLCTGQQILFFQVTENAECLVKTLGFLLDFGKYIIYKNRIRIIGQHQSNRVSVDLLTLDGFYISRSFIYNDSGQSHGLNVCDCDTEGSALLIGELSGSLYVLFANGTSRKITNPSSDVHSACFTQGAMFTVMKDSNSNARLLQKFIRA